MSNRKIEVFSAGCPACEPTVEMVRSMVCEHCDLTIYNVSQQTEVHDLITRYKISSLPAVVVDGRLLACCENREISRDELIRAGIGSPA